MAGTRFPVPIAATIAVLAILAGNMSVVMGSRPELSASQSIDELHPDYLSQGSWSIFNDLPDPLLIIPTSQITNIPPFIIPPQTNHQHNFAVPPAQTWMCEFVRKASELYQNFPIWDDLNHGSPDLTTCVNEVCVWRVQPDGFYWQNPDNSYTRQYSWIYHSDTVAT